MKIVNPVKDGLIQDFDALEAICNHAFENLAVDSKEVPILFSEKPYNPASIRYK